MMLRMIGVGCACILVGAAVWYVTSAPYQDEATRATVVVSIANIILVAATGWLAVVTSDTVREVRRDRELAQAPYLTVNRAKGGRLIRNVGSGPALHARYLGFRKGQGIWSSDPFILRAGGERLWELAQGGGMYQTDAPFGIEEVPLRDGQKRALEGVLEDLCAESPGETVVAFVCEDQLGTRYRFWYVPMRARPDVWKPGILRRKPKWAEWPLDQYEAQYQ
jgi:hypothetical protein